MNSLTCCKNSVPKIEEEQKSAEEVKEEEEKTNFKISINLRR